MLDFTRAILWSFQVTAFICALIYFNKYKKSLQHYFVYFLAYIVITEIIAYIVAFHYKLTAQPVYNIYTVVSFLFYLFWFRSFLVKKRIVNYFILLFIISVILALFYEDFFTLWRIPLTTGTILILICAFLFYSDLINKIEVVNYLKLQPFWIVTGLLMFYIGFLPLHLLQPYLKINGNIYSIAIMVLNIILSSCYIKSFLCLKK